jgi:2-C-methyl-D-erythritol 4-phosphate cytidylyltransferase
MTERTAIIVAGGYGSRMGADTPKQFLLLAGKPILMHTLQRFHDADPSMKIILVLPENEIIRWKTLIDDHNFQIHHAIVYGGNTRFESVRNGMQEVHTGTVGIHDGVRPLVSPQLILRCFEEAEEFSNAVPAIEVSDTIRVLEGHTSRTIDRAMLRRIQTPQCFDADMLKKAYETANEGMFTDDAGVFESIGNVIHLVDGEKNNIKITDREDLALAEKILNSKE